MATLFKAISNFMRLDAEIARPKVGMIYRTPRGLQLGDQSILTATRDPNGAANMGPDSTQILRSTAFGWAPPPTPFTYVSTSFVQPGQTLQAAVDAAPASSDLVKTVLAASMTTHGGGVYSVAATSKPTAFFIDAMNAVHTPEAFSGTTLVDGDGIYTGNSYLWFYDAANSRILFYNKGAAVPAVTLVNYHAVVAATQFTYDSVALRPGIVVVGLGMDKTEIRNLTNSFATMFIVSANQRMYYSVLVSAYSGLSDLTVVRNDNRTMSDFGKGFCGLVFGTETDTDGFRAARCRVMVDGGTHITGTYGVGIWFGCRTTKRGKNVIFSDCILESKSYLDIYETYTSNFVGLVIFERTPVSGGVFVDGASNTFIMLNSPYTNGNSENRGSVIQRVVGGNFGLNMGSIAAFPGFTQQYIAINSPHTMMKPDDINVTETALFGFTGAYTTPMLFRNSPIVADKLLIRQGADTTGSYIGLVELESSPSPAGEITIATAASAGFNAASESPLQNRSIARASYATQSATAKAFTPFSMSYANLKKRGRARILGRGQFGANGNVKTLKVQRGVGGALPVTVADVAGASVSGAINGNQFEYKAEIVMTADDTVYVTGQINNGGTIVPFMFSQALTAGQFFAMSFNGVGVTTGDITVKYQQIEVDG